MGFFFKLWSAFAVKQARTACNYIFPQVEAPNILLHLMIMLFGGSLTLLKNL